LKKFSESEKINGDDEFDDFESLRDVSEFVEHQRFSFNKIINKLPSQVKDSSKKVNGWSSYNHKMTSTPVKPRTETLIKSKYYHNGLTIPEEKEDKDSEGRFSIDSEEENEEEEVEVEVELEEEGEEKEEEEEEEEEEEVEQDAEEDESKKQGKEDKQDHREDNHNQVQKDRRVDEISFNDDKKLLERSAKVWLNDEPNLKLGFENLKEEDISQLSYKHIQLLLDENERLVKEVESCKTKLSILNGDYLGLTFNYQTLESKCASKEDEICQLKGKLAALEMQLKSQVESKNEFFAKLNLAESTIESLNRQLTNMAKSDSLVRVRENYETLLNKLRHQFESEQIMIKGEVEGLKFEVETKKQEINQLRSELEEKKATIDQLEIEKLENIENLKSKYQQIIKDNNSQIDFQALINQKNEEIESLQHQVNLLRKELESCEMNKPNVLRSESEVIKEIKIEFNKSLKNLKERRKQVNELQAELIKSAQQVYELKEKLKIAESKSENVRKMMEETNEIWKQQVEAALLEQFQKEWAKSLESFELVKQEEVVSVERTFNRRLEAYIKSIIEKLETFGQDISVPLQQPNELESMFQPLAKLWASLESALKDQMSELNVRQEEMLNARQNLVQALQESKSFEANSSDYNFDELRKEIEGLKNESIVMKMKLEKYKKHYHLLRVKHENAIKELKKESARLIASKEQEYEAEREKLVQKLKNDSDEIVKRLSNNLLIGLDQIKRNC